MTESRWLDVEAVAKILRVRASQVPGMVGRGRIPRPSYHLGYSSPRWDRAVLEASVRDAAMLKQSAHAGQEPDPANQREAAPAHAMQEEAMQEEET